jgi:hypothetical protein
VAHATVPAFDRVVDHRPVSVLAVTHAASGEDRAPFSMDGMAPLLRFMVIDADGQRIGRYESSEFEWKPGDVFELDERSWQIVEILPEVSTMVAYNAVWIAAPASS